LYQKCRKTHLRASVVPNFFSVSLALVMTGAEKRGKGNEEWRGGKGGTKGMRRGEEGMDKREEEGNEGEEGREGRRKDRGKGKLRAPKG
jgi:hypothetical protein